jgi:hypothetical protein
MVPHEVRAVVVSVHRLRYVVFLPTYYPPRRHDAGVVLPPYMHTYIRLYLGLIGLDWSAISYLPTYLP